MTVSLFLYRNNISCCVLFCQVPISSCMCYRCSFRSEILTIFFAFLLASFDLSCGQVPFRLHHAHAAPSTSKNATPRACGQQLRCSTFRYIHTCIHTYIHTSIHPYIHPSIHPYIHTYIHPCMHTYIHTIFLCHTPSFTYHFVTHNCFYFSILHHILCLSFLPRPATTSVAHYWKKLTCGVIRSFNDVVNFEA